MKKFSLLLFLITTVFINAEYKNNIPAECKKKIYCSQMKSCAEAKHYLKICGKYAKMDGDKDGIPCERQWCKKR